MAARVRRFKLIQGWCGFDPDTGRWYRWYEGQEPMEYEARTEMLDDGVIALWERNLLTAEYLDWLPEQ